MHIRFKAFTAQTALSLCAATLLLPGIAGAAAGVNKSSFTDIERHWARQTIEWAASQGIAEGYETGTFQPDRKVSEPEFLAMLIRTLAPGKNVGSSLSAEPWYKPYYVYAQDNHWMLANAFDANLYNRGYVAQLMASAQGNRLPLSEAVQFLLDEGLSQGKYAATVEGYASGEALTRAEAVQFLRNAKAQGTELKPAPEGPAGLGSSLQVGSVSLGDTAAYVQAMLGEPDRRDASVYGFEWQVYSRHPQSYTLVGIRDGKVAGLYTSGTDWLTSGGVSPNDTKSGIADKWGSPLSRILKGNTWVSIKSDGHSQVFERDGAYVTFYYDLQDKGQISGVKMVAKAEEQQLTSASGQSGDQLREAFERQVLDLANAERAKRGIAAMQWSDTAAAIARAHSSDMQEQGYFAHDDRSGRMPWDRAEDAGLSYRLFAENIAAGQADALEAHYGWLNSTSGHRENLLGSNTHFGAGVAFGGKYRVYYTENFYTPY
ncbi:CAP-associated domain-containing protein [Paenibacillus sp. YN15]|uniref:CAP-associated domain-containing protein n=1 Tax=Paenibacillus sp. YN15 TaxID=1742774 RepID=UPI000DCC9290|nr:CAP-associated domain-containing protein [Paenibacillus sp. YN15]RAU94900.1 copper amine oxidase [Paenibacillus sp. YN15]